MMNDTAGFSDYVKREVSSTDGTDAELNNAIKEANSVIPETPKTQTDPQKEVDDWHLSEQNRAKEISSTYDKVELPEAPKPKEGEAPREQAGFFALSELKNAASAAGMGVLKAGEDAANAGILAVDTVDNLFAKIGLGDGTWVDEYSRLNLIEVPDHPGDRIVFSVARYLLPFAGLGKLISKTGLIGAKLTTAQVAAAGTYTTLTADRDDKGLVDLLNTSPESTWHFLDGMTSKPEDTAWERRAKRGLESVGVDVLALGMAGVIKSIVSVKKARDAYKAASRGATKLPAGINTVADVEKAAALLPKGGTAKAGAVAEPHKLETTPPREITDAELADVEGVLLPRGKGVGQDVTEVSEVSLRAKYSEKYASEIAAQKRNVLDWDKASAGAKAKFNTPEKVEALIEKAQPGVALNEEENAALLLEAAGRNEELVQFEMGLGGKTELTPAEMMKHELLINRAADVAVKLIGSGSQVGRILNQAKMVMGAKSAVKKKELMEEFSKLMGDDINEASLYMRAAMKAGAITTDLVTDVAKNKNYVKVSNIAYHHAINGMLGDVMTFTRNLVGPPIKMIMHGAGLAANSLDPRSPIHLKEAIAYGKVKWSTLLEAIGAARSGFLTLQPPKGFTSNLPSPEKLIGNSQDALSKVARVYIATTGLPGRALVAGDNFNKILAYRSRIQQQAQRIAMETTDDVVMQRKIADDIIKSPPRTIREEAVHFADNMTFSGSHDDLIFGDVGKALRPAMSWLPFGLEKLAIPFERTITNIADTKIRYSPFAYLFPKGRADLLAKSRAIAQNLSPDQIMAASYRTAEAQGKVYAGVGTIAFGALLGAGGYMKGTLHSDFVSGKSLDTEGVPKERSLRVGKSWISLQGIDPIQGLLSFGADIAHIMKYVFDGDDDDKIQGMISDFTLATTEAFLPEYITNSTADFYDAFKDILAERKTYGEVGGEQAAKFAEVMTPFRYIGKNIGKRYIDPVKRDTKPSDPNEEGFHAFGETLLNNLANTWGAASWRDLPVTTNILNQPINIPPGFVWSSAQGVASVISPFFTNEEDDAKVDPVIMGLRKLGLDRADMGHLDKIEMDFVIKMPSRTTYKMQDRKEIPYKLTPKQYASLIKHMNAPNMEYAGATLKETLGQILASEHTDEKKRVFVKEALSDYLKNGKTLLGMEYPEIEESIEKLKSDRKQLMGRPLLGVER